MIQELYDSGMGLGNFLKIIYFHDVRSNVEQTRNVTIWNFRALFVALGIPSCGWLAAAVKSLCNIEPAVISHLCEIEVDGSHVDIAESEGARA